jgi:two-component sensor histidine kinase
MQLRLSNHLIVFALICLAPVILAVLVVGYDVAAIERQRLEDRTVALVRDFQGDLDGEARTLTNVLEALATSASIDHQDWEGFQQQASVIAARIGAAIVLRTLDGKHLVNTLVPDLSTRDITTADPELRRADAKAIASRAPALSNLCRGATSQGLYVAFVAPVLRGGEPVYLLSIAITTDRIAKLLDLGKLSEDGWLASVIGSDTRLVARTRDPETFVGTPVSAEIKRVLAGSEIGVLQSRTLDGIDVFTAYKRTQMGWWVLVSVPLQVLHAPVRALVIVMLFIAGSVLAVAVIAAWTYGRLLGREVSTLSRNALAMGQNATLQPYSHHIVEVADAQQALFDAQRRVEDLIAELNHRVKNTLTVIKVLANRSVGSRRDRDAVSARISALTIAHEALTETHWQGADLAKLAQAIARGSDFAIFCAGPTLILESKATVALAQVLQELLSNARQHGALRERSGVVQLIWIVKQDVLHLEWQERSPLRPQSPDHAAGFGLKVVELCVVRQLGGILDVQMQPHGWTVVMCFPMSGELGTMARLAEEQA